MQGAAIQALPEKGEQTNPVDAVCLENSKQLRLSPTDDLFYHKATSFASLFRASKKCGNGVRWKDSVQAFEHSRLFRTLLLKRSLDNKTYSLLPYTSFTVWEPKKREVLSTKFRDRVFQRSLCDSGLYSQITKGFIYDNSACQVGKGVDFAVSRLSAHAHRFQRLYHGEGWVVKIDIHHFFPSIPHSVAIQAVRKRVKDPEARFRVEEVIHSFPDSRTEEEISKDPFGKRGLALGSQLSQLLALAVLDDLDHSLKEKKMVKFYLRYMDDLILFLPTKEEAKEIFRWIREEVSKLGLEFNPKSSISPFSQTHTFLKFRFRVLPNGKILKLVKPKSLKKNRKKFTKMLNLAFKENKIPSKETKISFLSWKSFIESGNNFKVISGMKKFLRKLQRYLWVKYRLDQIVKANRR